MRAEEERFGETLERGLKLFENLAGNESISGEEAFTLAATYGSRSSSPSSSRRMGQPVDVDGYRTAMERHREVSRAAGSSDLQRAADFAREAGSRASSSATRRPTSSRRSARSKRSRTASSWRSSASRPSTRPEEARSRTRDDRARRRLRDGGRARRGVPLRGRSGALPPGPGSPRETARAVVAWNAGSRRWRTHGDAPPALALRDVLGEHVRQAGSAVA